MQLSGLASGMDWQNVVDQLMELERFPIRKAQNEQAINNQRITELGILETKLNQLKGAANSLSDSSLWDARSVSVSDEDNDNVSAIAATGTLTGDYTITDATKASSSVLEGQADITTNIASADTIENLNTSTAVYSGTFTINGTVFTIDSSGGSGGDFALDDTLATAVTQINAKSGTTGVTAAVSNGKMYLESSSEIILGHADDSSNFLGVMKLFSQNELNYKNVGGVDYYSKTETAGTTSTTNFFRAGEYVWDGTNYYQVLSDAPRGSDLSAAGGAGSPFAAGVAAPAVAQVDTISGLAADSATQQVETVSITAGNLTAAGGATYDVTVNGTLFTVTEGVEIFNGNTADQIAAALQAKINAGGAGVTALASGGGTGQLTLTANTAGTGFTMGAVSTTDTGAAAVTSTPTQANISGDTFTVNINGTAVSAHITTGSTGANIATDIAAAINGSGVAGTVTANVVGSTVEVTANSAGTAFSLSVLSAEGTDGVTATAFTNSTTTPNDPGSPDQYRSLSEFTIGSIDPSKSIRAALGSLADGTYAFTINDTNFTLKNSADLTTGEIDIDNTTLQQLLDKVNASAAGVSMSYNPVEDRFQITNKDTGSLRITAVDTTGTLLSNSMKLDYDADSATVDSATLVRGSDATLTINGTTVSSNSNSVTGEAHGIDGLIVNIKESYTSSTSDQTFTVAADTSGAKSAIDSFISEYNSAQRHLSNVTQTTTTDDKVETSIFSDNLEVTSLVSGLRAAVFGDIHSVSPATSGTGFERIQDIGIDFSSGTSDLQITDSSKLSDALSNNGAQVKEIFMSQVEDPDYYISTKTYSKGETVESDGVLWIALKSTTGNAPPSYDTSSASANIDSNWSFYGFKDNVSRRVNDSSDYTGTPVLTGLAYGMAYRVKEFIDNFNLGSTPDPDDTETDGSISIQKSTLQDANDKLDTDISNLETLLAQREQQMVNSFIRMEEMQAQLQSQSKMLQSSIDSNFGSGKKK